MLSFAYTLLVNSAFPWAAAVIGIGSKMASQSLDKLLLSLEQEQRAKEIVLLRQCFFDITANLRELNNQVEQQLFRCLDPDNENLATSVQSRIFPSNTSVNKNNLKWGIR